MSKLSFFDLLLVVVLSCLAGYLGARLYNPSNQERIKNLYADEMSVFVSPTTIKKYIDTKDQNYVLVDLRSKAEYDAEHVVGAVNIPAVSLDKDQIIAEFKKLPSDKQIIVHCYSAYCTLGRQIGQLLSENGIFVKEMDAGWSEWRYHWDLWNPGASIDAGKDYVIRNPAATNSGELPKPCSAGVYGC